MTHDHGDAPNMARTQITIDGAPLSKSERGLVIAPPAWSDGATTSTSLLDANPQDLRFYLLYWDRVDLPNSTDIISEKKYMTPYMGGPESNFLHQIGFIQHSDVSAGYRPMVDKVVNDYLSVFHGLDKRDPGQWSVGTNHASQSIRQDLLIPDRGLLVELYQAIPVPDREVPFDDILKYKENRRSELLAYRSHLEGLYEAIIQSPDRPLSKTRALDELDHALKNVIRTGTEMGWKFRLSGFEAKLDLVDVVPGAIAGAAVLAAGLPATQALLAGLISSVVPKVSVKTGLGLKREHPTSTPFEYVSKAYRDLFNARKKKG